MEKLKEYLLSSEFFGKIPYRLMEAVAQRETEAFFRCADIWFENTGGGFSFESVSDMFSYYYMAADSEGVKMQELMESWWGTRKFSSATEGEKLNEEIMKFFRENSPDVPIEKIPCFDKKSFGRLFGEETMEIMKPDFYSYFNPSNKTFIRFEGLPRLKYFPWCISRKRVLDKIEKNRYRISLRITHLMMRHFGSCVVGGKSWNDYITELIAERVCGV